jgi:hypothetical protein
VFEKLHLITKHMDRRVAFGGIGFCFEDLNSDGCVAWEPTNFMARRCLPGNRGYRPFPMRG